MSYPLLPKNRLIVNGTDLSAVYGLILTDNYILSPPPPKTHVVDIPGGNGTIDMTDALLGDTAYDNRPQEFEFAVIAPFSFEETKTEVSNFLHGKKFKYQITMDPEYTYVGRFTVSSYSHTSYSQGIVGIIKVDVDAEPYKYKKNAMYKADAVGGKVVYLPAGRKRVRPTIESDSFVKLIYDNTEYTLPEGTWTVNDILLQGMDNELYLSTFDIKNLTWGDLKSNEVTWASFKTKRLFEWYKSNGDGTMVIRDWESVRNKTWNEISVSKWSDLYYMADVTKDIKEVYITYEVGDL